MRLVSFLASLLLTFWLSITGLAQTNCRYCPDLDRFLVLLTKTKSFQTQFKGSQKKEFEALSKEVRNALAGVEDAPAAFRQMTRLVAAINDNHLFFYENPARQGRVPPPRYDGQIGELEQLLTKKKRTETEGIYSLGEFVKMGLRRVGETAIYEGIVVESKVGNWTRGEIILRLEEYQPQRFRAMQYSLGDKTLLFYRNERLQNGRLLETRWQKQEFNFTFADIARDVPVYQYREISPSLGYLRLGSFSASDANLRIIEDFYESVRTKLTTANLIVDLRNNGGGGFKASGRFLKLLRSFGSKGGHVFIIVNGYTVSNAEEFVIELKKEPKVTIIGETTRGTITYGSNYGRTETLPSGDFRFYPTDLDGSEETLKFESIGIRPDIELDFTSPWLDQTIEIVNRRHPVQSKTK